MNIFRAALIGLMLSPAMLSAALAQNPFSAAVTVNNRAVTYWEISQRARFMELLNAPGDLQVRARENLIDERLQIEAAETQGLLPSDEDLIAGMQEFAGRANLTAEVFVQQLGAAGVDGTTFRDFVYAGLAWRNVVRARFGPRAQVTEEEVDRALTMAEGDTGARVLLSEIVIPVNEENRNRVRSLANDLSQSLEGDLDGFASAARQYAAAQSARAGGALGWRPVSALPPGLVSVVVGLPPGGVTEPLPLGNAIALFQLREFEESQFVSPEVNALDYVILPIAGGRSESALAEAAALRDEIDTCDDLYGVRPDGFTREVQEVGAVPAGIATELAGLDANEVSVDLTTASGDLMFLMLCSRTTELPDGFREQVRQSLFNQRLESYANGYLEELRAEAIISEDG